MDIGALLEPEIPRLRRYARVLTGDVTRADDLVEDCLCHAVRTVDLFWSGTDLRAWLFTILHDQLAGNGRPVARELPTTAIDAAAKAVSTHQSGLSALTLENLRRALACLSDNERQVVFITGEAGMGKTALADEFERRAIEAVRRDVRCSRIGGRHLLEMRFSV